MAVKSNSVDYGLLPIEHSRTGSYATTYELIAKNGLSIVGEVTLPQTYCLLANEDASEISQITSHPLVFQACKTWISSEYPHAHLNQSSDTAQAAKDLAEKPSKNAYVFNSKLK